jgi:hypothetical protein
MLDSESMTQVVWMRGFRRIRPRHTYIRCDIAKSIFGKVLHGDHARSHTGLECTQRCATHDRFRALLHGTVAICTLSPCSRTMWLVSYATSGLHPAIAGIGHDMTISSFMHSIIRIKGAAPLPLDISLLHSHQS